MATNIYATVDTFHQYPRSVAAMKCRCQLTLFLPTDPMNLIAVVILDTLPRTRNRNQYVTIITSRNSKLSREIPIVKTSTLHVATIAFDNWLISHCIPSFLLPNTGSQFVAKLFEELCLDLKITHLTTMACLQQKNDLLERYNKFSSLDGVIIYQKIIRTGTSMSNL